MKHKPRRRIIRTLLRQFINSAFRLICSFELTGVENFPNQGPLLVAGNHFSFLDPVALIGITPLQIEFVGGTNMPNAPAYLTWLTKLYGYYPVHRGGVSRDALIAARKVLKGGGVLGIFPEAGSWAQVLRPPRPGLAYLAATSGAPVLPVGLNNFPAIFRELRKGKRAHVQANIGKPFYLFPHQNEKRPDREELNEAGHRIMRAIAELIPSERRGFYSDDPKIRDAAKGTEIYPWENDPEI